MQKYLNNYIQSLIKQEGCITIFKNTKKGEKLFFFFTVTFVLFLALLLVSLGDDFTSVVRGYNTTLNPNPVGSLQTHGFFSGRVNLNISIALNGTESTNNITNVTFIFTNQSFAAATNFTFNNNTYTTPGFTTGLRTFSNGTTTSGFSPNFTIDTTTLLDGIFNITINITNTSGTGLANTTFLFNVTIDNTNPKIGVRVVTPGNITANATSLVINVSLTELNLGNRSGNVSLQILRTNGVGTPVSVLTTINMTIETPAALLGGADQNVSFNLTDYINGLAATNAGNNTRYYINISVKDLAGNVNVSDRPFIVILDNIVPQVNFSLDTPSNGSIVRNNATSTLSINYSLVEASPANVTFTLYNATFSNVSLFSLGVTPNLTIVGLTFNTTNQLNPRSIYFARINVTDAVSLNNITETRTYFWDTFGPFQQNSPLDSQRLNGSVPFNITADDFLNIQNITLTFWNGTTNVSIQGPFSALNITGRTTFGANGTGSNLSIDTSFFADGWYNVTINGTNLTGGNIALNVTFLQNVMVTNRPLQVGVNAPTSSQVARFNSTIFFNITADDFLQIQNITLMFWNSSPQVNLTIGPFSSINTTSALSSAIRLFFGSNGTGSNFSVDTSQFKDGYYNVSILNATNVTGGSVIGINTIGINSTFITTILFVNSFMQQSTPVDRQRVNGTTPFNITADDFLQIQNITLTFWNGTTNVSIQGPFSALNITGGSVYSFNGTGSNLSIDTTAFADGWYNVTLNATNITGFSILVNVSFFQNLMVVNHPFQQVLPVDRQRVNGTTPFNLTFDDFLQIQNVTFTFWNGSPQVNLSIGPFAAMNTSANTSTSRLFFGSNGTAPSNFSINTAAFKDGYYNVTVNGTNVTGGLVITNYTFFNNLVLINRPFQEFVPFADGSFAAKNLTVNLSVDDFLQIQNITLTFWNSSPQVNLTLGPFSALNASALTPSARLFFGSNGTNNTGFVLDTNLFKDGTYNVTINGTNVSGGLAVVNYTFLLNFSIDNTFPKIGVRVVTPGNITANASNLVINLSLTETNLGNRGGNVTIYLIRLNGSDVPGEILNTSTMTIESTSTAGADINLSINFTQYINGALANNTANNTKYYINISVMDLAGNVNVSDRPFIVILDNLVPQIDYSTDNVGNGTSLRGNFVINYSLLEANPVNVTFTLYNDTFSNVTLLPLGTSPNKTLAFMNYSASSQLKSVGAYYVRINVTDAVLLNNLTTTRTYYWDTSPPSPNVQTSSAFNTFNAGETTTITCATSDVEALNRPVRTIILNLTDGTSLCTATNTTACSATYTPTASGTKTAYCHTVDLAGNVAFTTLVITINPAATGSGGGGGGGGGGSASYTGVSAGAENTYTLGSTSVGVDTVTFTTNTNVDTAKVTVKGLTAPSGGASAPSSPVYKYFEVNKVGFDNTQVATSSIVFTVSKVWLDSQKISKDQVVLLKYDTNWKELSTHYVKTLGDTLYFEAATQGFSLFAISGKGSSSTPVSNVSSVVSETPVSNESSPVIGTTVVSPRSSRTWLWVVVVLVVVVAIVVVMMKKRGEKSEWSHRPR